MFYFFHIGWLSVNLNFYHDDTPILLGLGLISTDGFYGVWNIGERLHVLFLNFVLFVRTFILLYFIILGFRAR